MESNNKSLGESDKFAGTHENYIVQLIVLEKC
jgi:hypothetical protein